MAQCNKHRDCDVTALNVMFARAVSVSVTEYHLVLVQLSTTMENKTKIQKIHINILKLRKRIVWRVYFESLHHIMKVRIFLFSKRFRLFLSSNMEFHLSGWSQVGLVKTKRGVYSDGNTVLFLDHWISWPLTVEIWRILIDSFSFNQKIGTLFSYFNQFRHNMI